MAKVRRVLQLERQLRDFVEDYGIAEVVAALAAICETNADKRSAGKEARPPAAEAWTKAADALTGAGKIIDENDPGGVT